MSLATIERMVAGRADSEFYTGGPALEAHPSAFQKMTRPDLLVAKQPRWARDEISRVGRSTRQSADHDHMAGTHLESFVFQSFDMTGVPSQQVLDLIGELATRPRSYAQKRIALATHDEHELEHITADIVRPLDSAWLVAAYDAVFSQSVEEDDEIDFDPDDYPVI